MARATRWSSIIVVLALAASACSGGGDEDAQDGEPDRSEDTAESWTIIQYSMADTNLELFQINDMAEMAEVGTQDGLNLVAFVDRHAEETDIPLGNLGDWVGAKTMEVGQGEFTELADLGPVDSTDPAVFTEFLSQALADYPADRYGVIISDHGASWPGIGPDDSTGDGGHLDLAEIQGALAESLAGADIDRFDFLGFDACLMASYEVASAMAPYADRMIASEQLEPGHGWDYRVLQLLADDPSTDADAIGTAIIDSYEQHAVDNDTADDITLSLLDLTQMPALDEAMETFTTALIDRGADIAPIVGQEQAQVLGFGRSPDPSQDSHVSDLGLLVAGIQSGALDVSDQADAVLTAVNDVVKYSLDSPVNLGATGLSVYFPPALDLFNADYDATPGSAIWGEFLASYYGTGAAIPADEQPEFIDVEPGVFFDEDGLNIQGTFDQLGAENLSEAFIRYALVEGDGSLTYLGQEPGLIADDGSGMAQGIYDLTQLIITDGVDEATAFVDLAFDDEAGIGTLDVPMAYYPPGVEVGGEDYEDVLLSIVFDAATGDVTQETYYVFDEETGSYGELSAEPDGLLVPLLLNVMPDGTEEYIPTSDVGLFADLESLLYELRPLESGTLLQAELTVVDYGGNTDTVSTQVSIP